MRWIQGLVAAMVLSLSVSTTHAQVPPSDIVAGAGGGGGLPTTGGSMTGDLNMVGSNLTLEVGQRLILDKDFEANEYISAALNGQINLYTVGISRIKLTSIAAEFDVLLTDTNSPLQLGGSTSVASAHGLLALDVLVATDFEVQGDSFLGKTSLSGPLSQARLTFAADDQTPSIGGGGHFTTGINTSSVEITDLDDVTPGQEISICGQSSSNSSFINDAGFFFLDDNITLAQDVCIKLLVRADNNYLELNRSTTATTSFVEITLDADQLTSPNSADWAVNALAPLSADSNNAGLSVRLFDDTTEEGIGTGAILAPVGSTAVSFKFRSRAETAPPAFRTAAYKVYARKIPNGAAVSAWSAGEKLGDITIPSNETFQYDEAQISFGTLGITAGELFQLEITRVDPTGGVELPGDLALISLGLEFSE